MTFLEQVARGIALHGNIDANTDEEDDGEDGDDDGEEREGKEGVEEIFVIDEIRLKKTFELYDTNLDGGIDASELLSWMIAAEDASALIDIEQEKKERKEKKGN